MPWLIEDVRFWEFLEYGKWEGTVLLTLGKDWKSVCPTSTSRITPTSWLCPGCEVWGWQDLRRKWFYGTPERLYLNTWPESSSQSNDSSALQLQPASFVNGKLCSNQCGINTQGAFSSISLCTRTRTFEQPNRRNWISESLTCWGLAVGFN